MSEWKTIDSAPKDRTPIILGRKGYPSQQGRFYGEQAGYCSDNSGGDGTFEDGLTPTHWMPLPKAPDHGDTNG